MQGHTKRDPKFAVRADLIFARLSRCPKLDLQSLPVSDDENSSSGVPWSQLGLG